MVKGCKPCGKPIPPTKTKCKPFSMCVGNYTFYWDGTCASVQPRTYTIPDGTYTAITFKDGCVVDVGQAPLLQYTPQACCDGETGGATAAVGGEVKVAKGKNNLATMLNGAIVVEPYWSPQGNIKVTGNGTADKPWEANVKLSKSAGNNLVMNADGLYANLHFKTTGTVEVQGDGSKLKPYQLNVKGAEAKLPKILEAAVEGPGYEIDEFGRFKPDDGLKIITNLAFDNPAFTVQTVGPQTTVNVDLDKLQGATKVDPNSLIVGNGTKASPLSFNEQAMLEKVIARLTELGYKPS